MEKKKALAAVMATMLIASSLTACGGTKDTENMDASQTSSAQTQAVSLDGDKTTTVKTVKMGHYKEYDITNKFYIAMGYKELECFPTLWDEWNPCQIYIKYLGE